MLDLNQVQIMGIINLAPDSFAKVGKILNPDHVVGYAKQLISQGASIIDIGAEPTNPNLNQPISLQQEMDRLMPTLERLKQETNISISVDTSKPAIMSEAIKQGAKLINDVRGFSAPGALEAVAKASVKLCIMHMSYPAGKPEGINAETFNPDVITVIKQFFEERIMACENAGIARSRLIIDPGLGFGNFGKNTQDNLKLLKHLSEFKLFMLPILVGASRKTFIGDILKKPSSERLWGSLAAAAVAVYNGATIIRTHDVKETFDVIRIAMEIRNAS